MMKVWVLAYGRSSSLSSLGSRFYFGMGAVIEFVSRL
jgi:hypothetical protein